MNPIEPHTLTPYAASLERVPYTGIRELGEAAMAMDGVLRLYFGESNVPTPQFIVDAAVRALAEGFTFYSENAGLPSLRQALADQYRRLHDVTLDPEREIVITASGLQALHVALRSALDPGDEALILSPGRTEPRSSCLRTESRSTCRSRLQASGTRSTSPPSRPKQGRARASSCSPRRPTRLAGSPASTSSAGCSSSAASAGYG